MKGCLSVSAWRIGDNVHFVVDSLNPTLNVSASRLGERLKVSAHHICTVNKASFLNVVPDVVWLSPDELASADFDIISNVEWVIN